MNILRIVGSKGREENSNSVGWWGSISHTCSVSLMPHSQSGLEPRGQPWGSQDIYHNQIPPLPSPHVPESSTTLWCPPFLSPAPHLSQPISTCPSLLPTSLPAGRQAAASIFLSGLSSLCSQSVWLQEAGKQGFQASNRRNSHPASSNCPSQKLPKESNISR